MWKVWWQAERRPSESHREHRRAKRRTAGIIKKMLKHLELGEANGLNNRSPPARPDGLFNQATTLI
jgi:hypothetical protein